jgi:DNA-binding transcriptional regulator YdaS (Cro superfamily)
MSPNEALQRAIQAAGAANNLASRLGITAQAISQWDQVPPLRVIEVERVTGVSRHDLRPDIYPEPAQPQVQS